MWPFASLFQCEIGLVFNLKSLMVNLHLISSPIMLYSNHIQICWFFGYTTPETFDKTNGVVYQSLTRITIHMPSKSWIHHIIIRHMDSPI
jgi:hypothetical protein